jgi:acetolactate synthase-1/2/3 large subunit
MDHVELAATTPAAGHDGWIRCAADDVGDVLVAAMALGGVDQLFFTSGSDILVLQEAYAKAKARDGLTPELVTVLHEAVALNAALGYSMVSGRPAATAVHVDVGLQNVGCALHTAFMGEYPVLILSGSPPTAFPGTAKGARDHPVYWLQEPVDQRSIARSYTKWEWRLELQHNPGLVVSRALQVALAAPQGPALLTLPREVAMAPLAGARFPSLQQLGRISPPGPDPAAIDELAGWLLAAERPVLVTGRSGKDPEAVRELVRVAELTGAQVTDNGQPDRLNFPTGHPLFQGAANVADADLAVVIDKRVPWVPRPADADGLAGLAPDADPQDLRINHPARAPAPGCRVAWLAHDPGFPEIPLLEFRGDLRISADPRLGLRALAEALEDRLDAAGRERAAQRLAIAAGRRDELTRRAEAAAQAVAARTPIDPRWLAHELGRVVDEECIVLDEALSNSALFRRYYRSDRPGSYYAQGGSGGGWGSGAALGAKLAEPERDVVMVAGDGFYGFGVPGAALWSAVHHRAPYLAVVFVNARFTTGTDRLAQYYPGGFGAAAGFPGGRFDPPPDFAAEARAAGAHGEYVDDPSQVEPALRRGLALTREGAPAVLAVRVA